MTTRTKSLIGGLVLIILVLGGVIWYMTAHPALKTPPAPTASTVTSTNSLSTTSGPLNLNETGTYDDIKALYPGSTALRQTAGASVDSTAVNTMKAFETDTIATFKKDGNFVNLTPNDIHIQGLDAGARYSLDIEYKSYQGSHTVSYIFTIYEDTLGAHPNTSYKTFIFDKTTGANLALGDLFTSDNYLTTLSTLARAALPAMLTKMEGSWADTDYIKSGTEPTSANFQNFYIDGTNLIIVFAPYQVGPYALGTITLPVPLSQLGSILKPAYQ